MAGFCGRKLRSGIIRFSYISIMPRVKNKKRFGRKRDQRRALILSLSRALVVNEKIKTTHAKARELRPFIEKTVTRAKENTVFNRRFLARRFSDEVAKKLIEEIGPRYKDRPGGYTRIVKLGQRGEDGAEMAVIEFV